MGLAALNVSSWTPWSRSIGDALSSRISTMRDTVTPMRSGRLPGKLRASKAELLSG